jgi:phosphonoacetaldehyde hydrolase
MTDSRASRIKAVIFDWAGTTVDFGSRAPVRAFVRTFAQFGIELTENEARGPMGLAKRDHISALSRLPRIASEWERRHGHAFSEADIDTLYAAFGPISESVVVEHADVIPGVVEVVSALRGRGIRIGSTTGYSRAIMAQLAPRASAAGFTPDCVVCPDDVPAGRPSPLMMFRCFLDLGVWPASACVKVDDTVPGIAEGVASGSWAIGVTLSGNVLGLSQRQLASLSSQQLVEQTARGAAELFDAGAHVVIDTVADLLLVLGAIEYALARGETPSPIELTTASLRGRG